MIKNVYKLPPAFSGKRIKVEQDLVHNTSNPKSDVFIYETAIVSNAVCILPVLENGNIVLIKSYRYPIKDDITEVSAGLIDDIDILSGGSFYKTTAAIRELREETGYEASDWYYWGDVYSSPGFSTEKLSIFFAKNLTKKSQKLEQTEDIEVLELSLEKALDMIQQNKIKDSKTINAILLYNTFKGNLNKYKVHLDAVI